MASVFKIEPKKGYFELTEKKVFSTAEVAFMQLLEKQKVVKK